jgi:hypothetical protein
MTVQGDNITLACEFINARRKEANDKEDYWGFDQAHPVLIMGGTI